MGRRPSSQWDRSRRRRTTRTPMESPAYQPSADEPLVEHGDHLLAALGYASRGWPVAPGCYPDAAGRCACNRDRPHEGKNIGKAPIGTLVRRGFTGATCDEALLRTWWQEHPRANLLIPTGVRSGLAVLDIDPRNGGPETLEDLVSTYGPVPRTPMARTGGGGLHILFEYRGEGRLAKAVGPGMELLTEGSAFVAPPSLHRNGRRYDWLVHPDQMPPAPMPSWLVELGRRRGDGGNGADGEEREESKSIRNTSIRMLNNMMRQPAPPARSGPAAIRDWYTEPGVWRVVRYLGIPVEHAGKPFLCILHEERHPSAALWRSEDGRLWYKDFHAAKRGGPDLLILPEVYAARISGLVERLNGPSRAAWAFRLLVDAKILRAPHVPLPVLPGRQSAIVRQVYEAVKLIIACRALYADPGWPTPLTRSFLSRWTGLSELQVAKALDVLQSLGIIKRVRTYRRLTLYEPGAVTGLRGATRFDDLDALDSAEREVVAALMGQYRPDG